jgi:membrane-bound serine protease (ClpP class)
MNMDFAMNIDPNIVYLLLAAGLFFTVLAIFNPGTGLLEILALLVLFASGWGIYTLVERNLINWWSLLVTVVGMVLLLLAMRRPKQPAYLIVSIVCIVLGSAYLVRSDVWYVPGVNPYLALIVSVLSASFFWVAGNKVLEARSIRPTHDLGALVGALGDAKTAIHADGSVQVAGELWSAHSDDPIPNGAQVRVVERDGFTLKVEAVDDEG